jgi:hypothetical protein
MKTEVIYQSILQKLSTLPVDYLQQVEEFLSQLGEEVQSKEENRQKIMSFAGAWQDMPQEDFDDYLREAKKTGTRLLNRKQINKKDLSENNGWL